MECVCCARSGSGSAAGVGHDVPAGTSFCVTLGIRLRKQGAEWGLLHQARLV